MRNLASLQASNKRSHRSQATPADPASRPNIHALTAASWHAEDPISSSVPPPLPLLVEVEVLELELEVELFVSDVLVEASEGDSGVTVVPTTATLVVVGSGVTVVGIIVVVEDVAAAWGVEDGAAASGVEDVAAAWGVEDGAAAWGVEDVDVVKLEVLVVDVLASPAADWIPYAPPCPPLCP